MLIDLEKITNKTTPEQLLILSKYYSIVKNNISINDLEMIKKAAKIAEFDQAVFNLFEMFVSNDCYDFRTDYLCREDLLLDFREMVEEYEDSNN